MTILECLRLSTALVHSVRGATMQIVSPSGQEVTVGHQPSADLDPCAMRRLMVARECPHYSEHVADVIVSGSLIHIGGGVHRRVENGREQRWLATLLSPELVHDVFADCGSAQVPDDALHATIKHDVELAVTVVEITSDDRRHDLVLDEVAARVMSVLVVHELLTSTESDSTSSP